MAYVFQPPNGQILGGQAECKFGQYTNDPNFRPYDERAPLLVRVEKSKCFAAHQGIYFSCQRNNWICTYELETP